MAEVIDLEFAARNLKACAFKGKLKNYSTRRLHRHLFHEILLIKNGVSVLVDETARQPLFGTSLAFIPAGTPHRSLVVGQNLEYTVLFIDRTLFSTGTPGIKIFGLSELGLALFHKLCFKNGVEIVRGFSGKCFDLFLSVIHKDIKNESKVVRLPEPKNKNNLKIIEFIHNNYSRKLNITDFEEILPYTARHISRIFSKDLNISIFEYLRLYRILMASIRIVNEEIKITDIAFECGYDSLSSFYKDFKNYYGIFPKNLRKVWVQK